MPVWVKIVSAVVFPACMIAGIYFVGPMGFIPGAFVAIMVLFVLGILWLLLVNPLTQTRPLIAILAGFGVVAAAGYCFVGMNGVFGGWILAGGASLTSFCIRSLVQGKYDPESGGSPTRDVMLALLGLAICLAGGLMLYSAWSEQYEKTGMRWHVPVLMIEVQRALSR